jgi:hypothetical protein
VDLRDGHLTPDEFGRQHQAVMNFLLSAQRAPIGLPCDGQTFIDESLASFRDRLTMLRGAGYHFPHHVMSDVETEVAAVVPQRVD